MDKRQMRIEHTFTQKYHNWQMPVFVDRFTARTNTFDILEKLDMLEADVYRDREFTLANEMLDEIKRHRR